MPLDFTGSTPKCTTTFKEKQRMGPTLDPVEGKVYFLLCLTGSDLTVPVTDLYHCGLLSVTLP